MARRDASICRDDTHADSIALRPYSAEVDLASGYGDALAPSSVHISELYSVWLQHGFSLPFPAFAGTGSSLPLSRTDRGKQLVGSGDFTPILTFPHQGGRDLCLVGYAGFRASVRCRTAGLLWMGRLLRVLVRGPFPAGCRLCISRLLRRCVRTRFGLRQVRSLCRRAGCGEERALPSPFSERAMSAPPSLPEQIILMPSAPACMVRPSVWRMARRKAMRRSSWSATFRATR